MAHRTLGIKASFIRSITTDTLSDNEAEYLKAGGNKKFAEFMEAYELNSGSPIVKYKTKAAEYYRQQVSKN